MGDNADAFDDDANETVDSDGDGVGDNADAFDDDANETVDSDGDGVGDNADAFDDDPTEDTDSDGDGVGDNADAFPEDAERSTDDGGDSNDSSDDTGWSVVLKESGLDPNLVMGVIGIIIVMVGVFLMVSSRNVKKLKAELEDERVSSDMWGRLDYDKDGDISDLEFEAYKVIRDGGKKVVGLDSESDETEDADDAESSATETSIEEMASQDEDDSPGKGRYDS